MSYTPVQIVYVKLGEGMVGRLALIDRRIYFEYDPAFLATGLELSPFKLPLKAGAIVCDDSVFEGLFGIFNDSLPDGWGRLLLDRQVQRYGITPQLLTPLDRLTHVGLHGMGALCYEPDVSTHGSHEKKINLDHLANKTLKVLAGEANQVFSDLLELSGSSAGARPKIMVGVNAAYNHIVYGQQLLPRGYRHWMIKFASSNDLSDIGAVEYAYSLMAKAAGLCMPSTYLFPAKSGGGYFGVERFDYQHDQRLHMHSIAGLLHTDHRIPALDYETLLRVTLALTKNVKEVEKMFRLAVFNVLAHNRDDHSKNFAFLMQPGGGWQMAPAYDLTFSSGPGGEQSTTVLGEGRRPGKTQLLALAKKFTIKKASELMEEVQDAIAQWPHFAEEAGVSASSKGQIGKIIL